MLNIQPKFKSSIFTNKKMTIFIPLDSLDAIAKKLNIGPYADKEESSKIISQAFELNTVYADVEFEVQAPRDRINKKLYSFDKSLARLQKADFERHPRPLEAFTLITDGLEGKLSGVQKDICNDMLELGSYGEWLSLAFERNNDILTCYLDPEGLIWNSKSSEYVKDDFKFAEKKEFNIAGKPYQQWIELETFSNDFVQYIYGHNFKDLPIEMREGNKRAQVYLPPNCITKPVARGGYGNGYGFSSGSYWASRGVRAQKNFSGSVGGRK